MQCRWTGCQCPDDEPCTCEGCERPASEDPVSIYCDRHMKAMRPFDKPGGPSD